MGSNRVLKIRGPFGSLVDLSNPNVRSPYKLKNQKTPVSFEELKKALNSKIAVARLKKKNLVPRSEEVLGIHEPSKVYYRFGINTSREVAGPVTI